MMTLSNGDIFRVTGHLYGEFPAQRPMARSLMFSVISALIKRLSKNSWGWWFETPSPSLWRHCNVILAFPLKDIWCKMSDDAHGSIGRSYYSRINTLLHNWRWLIKLFYYHSESAIKPGRSNHMADSFETIFTHACNRYMKLQFN